MDEKALEAISQLRSAIRDLNTTMEAGFRALQAQQKDLGKQSQLQYECLRSTVQAHVNCLKTWSGWKFDDIQAEVKYTSNCVRNWAIKAL